MTEPRTRSWMPPIPGPLQRLFDVFPLTTYPANDLPARSPTPSSQPTLHVFISEDDAAHGRPSFNPSCLKWQTYLLLNHIPITLTPSTNHASPTGSLPFLLPPTTTTTTNPPPPIPSSRLETYISSRTTTPPPSLSSREEAYQSLLDSRIRPAWLHALYLNPANTDLLKSLYITPTSSSPLVRIATLHSLRKAAETEIVRCTAPTTGTDGWRLAVGSTLISADSFWPSSLNPEQVYADAEDAFAALASLLSESETGWFFGAEEPGLFDAAVFAYTLLVGMKGEDGVGGGLKWGDGGVLGRMVARAGDGELVRHRRRIWELCFTDGGRAGKDE